MVLNHFHAKEVRWACELTRGHILLCSSNVNRRKTKENTLTVTTRWRGKEETPSDLYNRCRIIVVVDSCRKDLI